MRATSAPRSRSPPDPATGPESAIYDTIRKLQLQLDKLEKERGVDRKWIVEHARRIDGMEAQVRAQTREAIEYARAKFDDVEAHLRDADGRLRTDLDAIRDADGRLRDDLDKTFRDLEAKVVNAVGAKLAEDKFKERIEAIEQAVQAQQMISEQHQAYLKARVDSKPGEEQTLISYFKYLEEEVNKIKGLQTGNSAAEAQKLMNETKSMVYQMGLDVKKDHDDKLGMVGAVMTQHQDRVEERLKTVDTEIMLMKAAFSSPPSQSSIRTPPGYAHLNMKGAYAGHDGCGGAAGHGDCGAAARAGAGAPGDRCGGDIPGGKFSKFF